jgi:hypothetical protein
MFSQFQFVGNKAPGQSGRLQNAKVLVGHVYFKFTDHVFIRGRESRTN